MDIIWLSLVDETPARGYWDQRLLEELFEGQNHIVTNDIEPRDEAIVVIPAPYQGHLVDRINDQLSRIKKCTVILTSDEENNFPLDELSHENRRVYAQYYNPKYTSDIRWIPIGPANIFNMPFPNKDKNFVFAGQVTEGNAMRRDFLDRIRGREDGLMIESQGFAQGLEPEDYYKMLSSAKVAPSPEGNVSPEAFRTWEAICAGAVPIASNSAWHYLAFNRENVPFPTVDNYDDINTRIDESVAQYPVLNNTVQIWWLHFKRQLKRELLPNNSKITVIVPCSPIKSHPSTEIIDETISTIRSQLPDVEIIVTFDGVREEQEDRRTDYEEFKRRFLWKCLNDRAYKNILPINFFNHFHQVKMARKALELVKTPMILYCEQDTPLTPDVPIEWQKCIDLIESGKANLVRFHFEAMIPEPHKHMMIGEVEDGFLRTSQWSQRPHLASTDYYRRILTDHFSEDAVCFIEDKMHGIVSEAYIIYGMTGWYEHRLWIYHPDGNIKRSYHTDGRAGELKWDDTQKW